MSCVFINHPLETWTPTASGALATIIWECCRIAEREGRAPWVITRSSETARFPWAQTVCIDPPKIPDNPILVKAYRAERKLTGWRHLRHEAYAKKVVDALKANKLTNLPLVLINDPEMAVYLRRHFPDATILHWFQNQLESSPKFQTLYGQANLITAGVSNFTSAWVKSYYGLGSVSTIYNAVDSSQFFPRKTGSNEKPVVSFVGRTGIEKAPDLLLTAAIELSKTNTNFKILMIGSNHWDRFELDDYQRELQKLIADLEARGIEVGRPGHVGRADLPAALRQADIHVVPSRWDEPFGLTTVEGMASGLAVVASDTGGTPEVVGDAGFLFKCDSPESLAKHLLPLLTDSKLRAEYAAKALARAEEFSWERCWHAICTQLKIENPDRERAAQPVH